MTTEERDQIQAFEREYRELRQANEVLCKCAIAAIGPRITDERIFCIGGTRPPTQAMNGYFEDQRDVYEVGSI